jgi:hypothetical protein
MGSKWVGFILISAFILLLAASDDLTHSGRIFDANSERPIEGALVTLADATVTTDGSGNFRIRGAGSELGVRAYGYQRSRVDLLQVREREQTVRLKPLTPKAVYLSFYGVGDHTLRELALNLIDATELNALVIDIKGDRGRIPYRSAISLAAQVGALDIVTIKDIHGLLKLLREKGIYSIARIVVFKDEPLASAKPHLAVKRPGGALWRDREGLAWTDPFKREVWDYNLAVAEEAARYGFDEIQFDYVRFPDARGLVFSAPNTEETRVKTIAEFLQTARRRLTPYNVFLAADLFGYICWNLDDTGIGQTLDSVARISITCRRCYTPRVFIWGFLGAPTQWRILMKSFIVPLHGPKKEALSRRCASGLGCKPFGTTRLTAESMALRKSCSKFAPPKTLDPMAGCCGIRATYILPKA